MMKEREIAVRASEEAGKILLKHFGKGLKIRNKSHNKFRDLVTQVDLESNKKIISLLKGAFPGYGILSEEMPEEKGEGGRWVIDPLDGTHNFTYGLPLFGVSIALEKKGRVVLGVINMPLQKQVFIAERGRGSLVNGRRIRVSKRGVGESLVTFGTGKTEPNKMKSTRVMAGLLKTVSDIRMLGSAVVHHTNVAMGRADAYIDMGNKPWDNAAGFLIVEEAGGKVTDLSGRPWGSGTIQFLVSNGKIHEEILRIINQ